MCMCMCIYIYIYIYHLHIYIYIERERYRYRERYNFGDPGLPEPLLMLTSKHIQVNSQNHCLCSLLWGNTVRFL